MDTMLRIKNYGKLINVSNTRFMRVEKYEAYTQLTILTTGKFSKRKIP